MKKNYYLLGAMLLSASLINAQAPQTILKYGFENGETFGIDGKGYIEFTDFSDEWAASGGILNLEYSDGYEGQCLQINSEGCGAAAQYQRSMKMRNLQKFEENTSYRLSYRVKAPENAIIRCMLMRGGNRGNDMPFVAESSDENSAYATYTYNVTGFNNSDWQYKSSMFYYSTDDKQKEFFHTHKPDFVAEELIDSSFVSINMFSEGEYLLDDVEIIPSNIAGAGYNGFNVRLDLGYETNYAELTKVNPIGIVEYPVSLAKVERNGSEVVIEAVELHSDGYLYIFLDEDMPYGSSEIINVSFTNPKDTEKAIKYSTLKSPYPWGYVGERYLYDIDSEPASFDSSISEEVMSQAWVTPKLISSYPENKSFEMPLDINEFTFTFSKEIDLKFIKAEMTGDNFEALTLINPDKLEKTKVVTFKRTGTEALKIGDYNIIISDFYEYDEFSSVTISFSAGVDPNGNAVSENVFVDSFADCANGSIPTGWTSISDQGIRESDTNHGGGARLFVFPENGLTTRAFYTRTTGNGVDGEFYYGSVEGYELTMNAGKHQLTYNALPWKGADLIIDFELYSKNDPETVIYSKRDTLDTPNQNGSTGAPIVTSKKIICAFSAPSSGDYIIKFKTPDLGGWSEMLIYNISIITMPSEAAYYKGLLNSALSDAKSELDICNNVIYHGDSHTALETYYNKYIDAVYNSPSPYLNAAEELNTATSILYTRRLNIDSYGENINKGYEYLGQCEGNKYEADQAYIELKDLCEKYSAIDCSSLSDQDLASVLKEITTIVSRGENIISCVDALTHAITKGLSAAKILNVENSILNIAANCITDDNDIRTELNRQVMRAWYKAVADNELSFDASTGLLQVYDEIEDYYENDSIDFSGFLRNPNLYTTYTNTILFDDGKFPGWTTYSYVSNNDTIFNDVDDYTINTTYAWEPGNGTGLNAEWAATSAKPVVDTQVSHVGGTGMIVQTVENLPAGLYNIKITGRRHMDVPDGYKMMFYILGETEGKDKVDTVKMNIPVAEYQWTPATDGFMNVEITDGKFTIGVFECPAYSSTTVYDNFTLTLVGKAKDFNYQEAYANGLEDVVSDSPVIRKEYYDINGIRYNKAVRGLNIIKSYHMNGDVSVNKIIVD